MVSKTRKQKSRQAAKKAMGITSALPPQVPKSVHLKKVRPNMKSKHKIRMGHESADIYDGFDERKASQWKCPECGVVRQTLGFCFSCNLARRKAGEATVSTSVVQKKSGAKKSAAVTKAKMQMKKHRPIHGLGRAPGL